MARYWWQCLSCGDRPAWLTVCRSRSIAAFVWDELTPGWISAFCAAGATASGAHYTSRTVIIAVIPRGEC